MKIRNAVVTAAGPGQRALPLQALVDRDGQQKSALQIVIEEAVAAGIEQICVVICPGDQSAYSQAAGNQAGRLHFVVQDVPRGYGHALYCARAFAGQEPFLHLVSDHLYVSHGSTRCAQQLVRVAEAEDCAVSAVQATRESMLPYYGTVGGRRVPLQNNLYEVESVLEKPTPTQAEQALIVPGLRAGHYLCFFGIHVLTPAVMEILGELISRTPDRKAQLSDALALLARKERYLAMEVQGQRHNIGVKYGLLMAQLALTLEGDDREEILSQFIELLAMRERGGRDR
ncbi:MAG: sugar phosphate nucleotidyltransferase [Tepidisphaerales bacterium]